MKTSDLDAVAPLFPVNRTAGRVAAKGDQFNFVPARDQKTSHVPCPSRPPPADSSFVDLTGQRIGKLTVIGYARDQGSKQTSGSLFNVKCVCGLYEQRRRKALTCPEYSKRAACSECDRVQQNREMYGVHAQKMRQRLEAKKSRRVV